MGVDNCSDDDIHQYIISEGTTLTIYNDGTVKNNQNQNICLAFTVDDIENEYIQVQALGVRFQIAGTERDGNVELVRFLL